MLPSVFGENLFDDSLSDFFGFGRMMPQISSELYGKHAKNLMKTDVRELDGSYELDVDLPGFKKDEVTVDLQDGYLTILVFGADVRGLHVVTDIETTAHRAGVTLLTQELALLIGLILVQSLRSADRILKISVPKAAQKEFPKHTTIAIE